MKTYVEVPTGATVSHHDTVIRDGETMRVASYRPVRSRWPGVLAVLVIGAGIAAFVVSSFYDDRTVGQRLDSAVAVSEQKVNQGVGTLKESVSEAARTMTVPTEKVATALNDAGITASVKTALAADPSLSAVKIDVTTKDGVVSLSGPAPDQKSRDRAEVLAAAPEGVTRVDNRVVVVPPKSTN
jgi:hyperosmotically inducible periplasmic protein